MNSYLVKSISFLLVFFPVALLSGSFFSDLFASMSSLLFLIYIIRNKEWKYFNNIFFKVFVLFYIYLVIRELFSGYNPSTFFYIRFVLFSLAINFIIDKDNLFLKNFLLVSVLTVIIIFIDSLSIIVFEKNILYQEPFNKYRLSSFLYDELKLGSLLLRLSPVIFAVFVYEKLKKNKVLASKDFIYLIGLYLAILIIIIKSGERASLILFFIATIIFFLCSGFLKIKYSFLIIFLSFFIVVLFFLNNKYLFIRYAEQFSLNSSSSFLEDHIGLFKASFLMFQDNPIFGNGLKTFRILCANYLSFGCTTHPHNTYLESLSEIGIFGFFFILFFFLLITYFLIQNFFNKSYNFSCVFLLSVSFINLFPFTTTGSFYGNWLSLLYYLPVGFLINFSKKK